MDKSTTKEKQYLPFIFTSQYLPVHRFSQLQYATVSVGDKTACTQLPCIPHGFRSHELVALKENR
jgi:hypothetical protein